VLDNHGVGIWTVEAFQVFPQTGTPEIVGLDDLGRVQVCAGYSGKWTPTTVVSDGKWLGGLAHDDGRILRHEQRTGDDWITETIYLGPQGPRGVVAGAFAESPAVETLAVFGYSRQVELLTRTAGGWQAEVIFVDMDKGHWLATAELDGRNATPEIITSGYSGRLVLLSRPPGFGRDELALRPGGGPRDTVEPFDAVATGELPGGWTSAITGEGAPCWTVERDPTAFSPPQVLRQSGLVPKPAFPLCLVEQSALEDGFVEAKFKTLSGEIDQAAGVIWRARDAANYYVCRANALEDNVVLYKVQDGKRQALDILGRTGGYGVEAKVAPGVWHTLRVEFAGARFRVLLDGHNLFEVEDATFTAAGRVGLWTKADSVTVFDDFTYGRR
jgi:hypothetical protein